MSLDILASPECYVDIYPPEGGKPTSFQGGAVLRARTQKSRLSPAGSFFVQLAPESLDANLSWGQILTPMSLVVVGMRRGSKSAITMVGFLNQIQEDQNWSTQNKVVTRTITLTGSDLAYYFTMPDYYTLWFLAAQQNAGFGQLAAGLLSGDPGDVAKQWYQQIMSGGVFKNTQVPYQSGNVKFSDLFGSVFEDSNVTIPYGDYFLGTNNSWFDKFNAILASPFYEFFVTTDSNNAYPGVSGGKSFQTVGLGDSVTGSPAVVGRLNPVPMLVTSNKNGAPSFDSIDVSKWNALPAFTLEGAGFVESSISFSDAEVRNFYNINFPYMTGLNGGSNSNFTMPIFNYASTGDLASVNRYGYRPLPLSVPWFADIKGDAAKKSDATSDNQKAYSTLIGQAAGYYEALPLMASADVKFWLRPDIQIGTKFTYSPYRSGETWDFYVDVVTQDYVFGGESATSLTLSRGLPSKVYQDSGTGGLLFAIHTGNAQRVGGEYKVGLPSGSATPLKAIPLDQFQTWLLQINQLFVTPQATVPASGSP